MNGERKMIGKKVIKYITKLTESYSMTTSTNANCERSLSTEVCVCRMQKCSRIFTFSHALQFLLLLFMAVRMVRWFFSPPFRYILCCCCCFFSSLDSALNLFFCLFCCFSFPCFGPFNFSSFFSRSLSVDTLSLISVIHFQRLLRDHA